MIEQTALSPCAFCGEPSTQQSVEITPAQYRTKTVKASDGRPLTAKEIVKPPVVVDLCKTHHLHHLEQQGWQQREEEKRKLNTRAAKERLKRDQTSIFDQPEAA